MASARPLEGAARQRALNDGVRLKRNALAVVAPFQVKLADWHERAAVMMAERMRTPTTHVTGADLTELRENVRSHCQEFADRTAELPPDVAAHTRIVDVRRSLDRLLSSLEGMEH